MARPRSVTKDMLQEARDLGMNAADASRHYGFAHSSIVSASKKLQIPLAVGVGQSNGPRMVFEPVSDVKVLTWSCSPAALQKYAKKRGISIASPR